METVNGQAKVSFPFSVVWRSEPLREIVPAKRLVVEAVTKDE